MNIVHICPFLFIQVPLIEKAGRRPLLLFPMIAMIFDLALITVALNLEVSGDDKKRVSNDFKTSCFVDNV